MADVALINAEQLVLVKCAEQVGSTDLVDAINEATQKRADATVEELPRIERLKRSQDTPVTQRNKPLRQLADSANP
jgi:hypothetical protein